MPAVAQSMITRLQEQRATMVAHSEANTAEAVRLNALAAEQRQEMADLDAILATLSPLVPTPLA